MSLPNTNELQTWDVDRVAKWLTQVGLSDCIETFHNRDIDGQTLSKFNEGKCMSLTGISMRMKRELWRHVDIYIEENPPLGSRPTSKIIPKGIQKVFGAATKPPKVTAPPIDYSAHEDDSDGEAWPEDEFDSDPEDTHSHQNHTSLSYETPSTPGMAEDLYEVPWDDPLAQKSLHDKLRKMSDEFQKSSSGVSSDALSSCYSAQTYPYCETSQELGAEDCEHSHPFAQTSQESGAEDEYYHQYDQDQVYPYHETGSEDSETSHQLPQTNLVLETSQELGPEVGEDSHEFAQMNPYDEELESVVYEQDYECDNEYDGRICEHNSSESDYELNEQDPVPGESSSCDDDEYEQPAPPQPSPNQFTAGLSPVHRPPPKPIVPDPDLTDDDFYELADIDSTSQPQAAGFNKSSTLPSTTVPLAPPPIKSKTLPPVPAPKKKEENPPSGSVNALKAQLLGLKTPIQPGPKRGVPTPPDSRKNSVPGSPQFPRSPKLGKLPLFRPNKGLQRESVSSLSSNSSDSGSGVIGPPPVPPRIPCPPVPTNVSTTERPDPIGQEDRNTLPRGYIPLPTPPSRPVPSVPDTSPDQDTLDGLYVYPWFHGSVTRDYSNRKLALLQEDGTFLIRKSTHGRNQPYSLDILFESAIKRLPIRLRGDGKYALGKEKDNEQTFSGVADLIVYHKEYPIFLVGSAGAEVTLKRTPPK